MQTRIPGCCKEGFFDCTSSGGGKCVPMRKFHDGEPDCTDRSDECKAIIIIIEYCIANFSQSVFRVKFAADAIALS